MAKDIKMSDDVTIRKSRKLPRPDFRVPTTLFTRDNICTDVMGSLHADDIKGIFIHADEIKVKDRADVIK